MEMRRVSSQWPKAKRTKHSGRCGYRHNQQWSRSGRKPHAPAPLDRYVARSFFLSLVGSLVCSLTPMSLPCVCTRRMMACNLFNKGPYNTGATPKGSTEGPMHPKYAIQ